MTQQRRMNAIKMTPEEIDDFLATEKTCRVATTDADGLPHVTPLWFAWDGTALWLTSLTRSKRWADIAKQPQVAIIVDAGEEYFDLRGVELSGPASPVGEAPRTGQDVPELEEPERIFTTKYGDGGPMQHDGKHGWLRVTPNKIVSWDFRKIPTR